MTSNEMAAQIQAQAQADGDGMETEEPSNRNLTANEALTRAGAMADQQALYPPVEVADVTNMDPPLMFDAAHEAITTLADEYDVVTKHKVPAALLDAIMVLVDPNNRDIKPRTLLYRAQMGKIHLVLVGEDPGRVGGGLTDEQAAEYLGILGNKDTPFDLRSAEADSTVQNLITLYGSQSHTDGSEAVKQWQVPVEILQRLKAQAGRVNDINEPSCAINASEMLAMQQQLVAKQDKLLARFKPQATRFDVDPNANYPYKLICWKDLDEETQKNIGSLDGIAIKSSGETKSRYWTKWHEDYQYTMRDLKTWLAPPKNYSKDMCNVWWAKLQVIIIQMVGACMRCARTLKVDKEGRAYCSRSHCNQSYHEYNQEETMGSHILVTDSEMVLHKQWYDKCKDDPADRAFYPYTIEHDMDNKYCGRTYQEMNRYRYGGASVNPMVPGEIVPTKKPRSNCKPAPLPRDLFPANRTVEAKFQQLCRDGVTAGGRTLCKLCGHAGHGARACRYLYGVVPSDGNRICAGMTLRLEHNGKWSHNGGTPLLTFPMMEHKPVQESQVTLTENPDNYEWVYNNTMSRTDLLNNKQISLCMFAQRYDLLMNHMKGYDQAHDRSVRTKLGDEPTAYAAQTNKRQAEGPPNRSRSSRHQSYPAHQQGGHFSSKWPRRQGRGGRSRSRGDSNNRRRRSRSRSPSSTAVSTGTVQVCANCSRTGHSGRNCINDKVTIEDDRRARIRNSKGTTADKDEQSKPLEKEKPADAAESTDEDSEVEKAVPMEQTPSSTAEVIPEEAKSAASSSNTAAKDNKQHKTSRAQKQKQAIPSPPTAPIPEQPPAADFISRNLPGHQ